MNRWSTHDTPPFPNIQLPRSGQLVALTAYARTDPYRQLVSFYALIIPRTLLPRVGVRANINVVCHPRGRHQILAATRFIIGGVELLEFST
jgi:hypothetical protein